MLYLVVLLAALLCVDNINLYIFNTSCNSTIEVVVKAQLLVNTWHVVMNITSRDLKLIKYYWTLQDYQ